MKALLQNSTTVLPDIADFKSVTDKDMEVAHRTMTYESLPEAVKKVLALRGVTQMSGPVRAIFRLVMEEREKGASYGCGSYMLTGWGQGNEVFAVKGVQEKERNLPAKIEFTIQGQVTSTVAQPIPQMPGEKMRKCIQYVLPLIGAMFHLKDGEVVLGINEVHWSTMLSGTPVNLAGFQLFLTVVQEVLGGEVLAAMDMNIRNGLTGPRWFQYVKERLTACSVADYLAVHTGMALYLLQRDKGVTHYMCTEMTEAMEVPVEWKKAVKDVQLAYRKCYIITGVLKKEHLPTFSYVEKIKNARDGERLSQVYASLEKLRSCLGSSTENYKQMTASRGYNSMMSAVERDHVWVVSATLAALSRYKQVAVKIGSQGSLPYLHRSYLNWLESDVPKEERDQYKLVFVVDIASMGSMNAAFENYCVGMCPEGFVCVWDHSAAMVGKMPTDEMENVARKQVAAFSTYPKLILRTAIFGSAMADKYSIHMYGTAWEFQGVLSNVGGYSMMMRNQKGYYSVTIPRVDNLLSWYDIVQEHHVYTLHGPWCPAIWVSEACNVVFVDKTKIKRVINAKGDAVHDMLTTLSSMSDGGEWDVRRAEEIKVSAQKPRPPDISLPGVQTTLSDAVITTTTTQLSHLPPVVAPTAPPGEMVQGIIPEKKLTAEHGDF